MANYTRNMKQDITYWAPGAPNVYGGRAYVAPVTLKGRWEGRQELFRDKYGQEVMSRARVYCESPVALDGYLYLGTSVAADPTTLSDAFEIRQTGSIPDLRAVVQLNVAIL